MAVYTVQNQWGGDSAPWHQGGAFVLGGRSGQNPVSVQISSSDDGKTFTGQMTYAGEGPIGFRGTQVMQNNYTVEVQWGGDQAPWHADGTWIIGARCPQAVVKVQVESNDGGQTLNGTMTYAGEGPIGFKGARQE
jgi:hypothetical protein